MNKPSNYGWGIEPYDFENTWSGPDEELHWTDWGSLTGEVIRNRDMLLSGIRITRTTGKEELLVDLTVNHANVDNLRRMAEGLMDAIEGDTHGQD